MAAAARTVGRLSRRLASLPGGCCLKILVLTNLYPPHYIGGYELICQTVVEGLRMRGHSVAVLASDHVSPSAEGQPDDPAVERSLKINGLYGYPWRGIRQLRAVEAHNNRVLRSAIARHQPDLVYVWNTGGLSKSMLFTLEQLGFPTVFYLSDHWIVRGLKSDVWLRWWNEPRPGLAHRLVRSWWTRTGARCRWDELAPTRPVSQLQFRRIYFCSRALRELTVAAGYDVKHGAVIYCPIHPRYLLDPPQQVRPELKRLLYVGRLAEDKGTMTALRALAQLRDTLPATLSIYGDGDPSYVRGLKDFCAQQKLNVQFATAGLDQMPAVYRAHDLLVFTSEWAEPFALTPIEAMASGLPVVGTMTGGSSELFRSGENALTYAAGNAEELAQRIRQFASDHSLRRHCAFTGCTEARERYAAPVIVDQIEEYLIETVRTWNGLEQSRPASSRAAAALCVS